MDAFGQKTHFFLMLLYRKHGPKQTSNHCSTISFFFNFKLTLLLQFLTDFAAVWRKLFGMALIFFCIGGFL